MSNPTPFWTRVCLNAIKRKRQGKTPFTGEHVRQASDWVTDTCGKTGDFGVRCLAESFYSSVWNQFPTKALYILGKIERRAAEVVAEQEGTP